MKEGREELHCLTPQPVTAWAEDGKPVCPALASQEGSEMPFLVVKPTHTPRVPQAQPRAEGRALVLPVPSLLSLLPRTAGEFYFPVYSSHFTSLCRFAPGSPGLSLSWHHEISVISEVCHP